MTCVSVRLNAWPKAVSLIQPPRKTAPSVRVAPTIDASTVFPGRTLYIHRPTSRAIGIVQAIVNVPHEEPGTMRAEPVGIGPSVCHGIPAPLDAGAGIASNEVHSIGVGVFNLNESVNAIGW